mmetsp:Transcript_5834/g.20430  ORF Transcript_5834/g.20430 Transcript_5834/m.20430 type:complete len:249 (+) Transcript_5834:916-1662(+)
MILQVLDWALAGDDGLNEESKHGNHGKTAVLDLLDLQLSEGVGIVSQAQRVKVVTTRVVLVQTLASGSTVHTVSLHCSHEDDLGDHNGNDGLSMDQSGVAKVIESSLGENLGTSLEPNWLLEVHTSVGAEKLRGDASKSSKHCPASVHQLGLAVSSKGLGISGEPSGIPAIVTGVLTRQVGGGVSGVRAQELGTVGSIPHGAGSCLLLGHCAAHGSDIASRCHLGHGGAEEGRRNSLHGGLVGEGPAV